jgi:hypothetical protein
MRRFLGVARTPVAVGVIAASLGAGALLASAAVASGPSVPNASGGYTYQTFDNPKDLTFNQLLGINMSGNIAGYFGSGMKGHPNKGYTLANDGKGMHFVSENFPHSAQTQVTAINDANLTVGFWANKAGENFGWYSPDGKHFFTADDPHAAKPVTDQLLGVNDSDVAVGFYNDAKGNAHPYQYNIANHHYREISVSGGGTSVTAAAINNGGDMAGFETAKGGATVGWVKLSNGKTWQLKVPGASATMATGINDGDIVDGVYMVGTGNSATSFGFIWSYGFGFASISDPKGVGATTLNGLNDHGRLVGFYTDSKGNTDGFLATPKY